MKEILSRISLCCIGFIIATLSFAQRTYLNQTWPGGKSVHLTKTGDDVLDVHHYGISCFGHNIGGSATDDKNAFFLRGNNNDTRRNYVNFYHGSYDAEYSAGKRFPNLDDDRTQDLIWIFHEGTDAQSGSNTTAFYIYNYKWGGYIAFNGSESPSQLQNGSRTAFYYYNDNDGLVLSVGDNYNDRVRIQAWPSSNAWTTKGGALTRVMKVRIYEAGLTHRENVILSAMKRSIGMYNGAETNDFNLFTTELQKNLMGRNYEQMRNQFQTLQRKYSSKSAVLPEGFYRIRSGANTSKNTGRVLYVDGSTPKWKTATGGDDEIWRVKKSGNGYLLTHYTTGLTLASATSATSASTQTFTIEALAQTDFPGHYAIHKGSEYLHASGWNSDNTSGTIINHSSADTEDRSRVYNIYRKNSDGGYNKSLEFPSASSWLFQTATRPALPQDLLNEVAQMLAGKDVARGFTATQLSRLEVLKADPLAMPAEIRAEIAKLVDESQTVRIPLKEGFYTIINAHPDFENQPHRLMYAEPNGAPMWHKQTSVGQTPEARDVWYVKPNGNGYTLTNVHTSFTMQAGYGVLQPKDYKMTIFDINKTKYPGRLLMHDQFYSYAHALNHHSTSATESQQTIGSFYNGNDYQRDNGQKVDGASVWKLKPMAQENVPNSDYLNAIAERHRRSEGRVFGYTAEQLATLKTKRTTAERFLAIQDLRKLSRIQLTANGLHRICNAAQKFSNNKTVVYLDYSGHALKWHTSDKSKVDELWKIVSKGNNGYEVTNPNTDEYIDDPSHLSPKGTAKQCQIIELDPMTHPSVVKIVGNNKTFNPAGHADNQTSGNIVDWGNAGGVSYQERNGSSVTAKSLDETSTWFIERVDSITLTTIVQPGTGTPKKFFTTFYYPFAVELPAELDLDEHGNMWAYIERTGRDSEFSTGIFVKPISGKKVKPRVPIILETKTHRPSISLKIIPESEATISQVSQVWKGTLAPVHVPAGTYIMINHPSYSGFYKTKQAGDMAPNKVYLSGSVASSSSAFYRLAVDWDETVTGLTNVEIADTVNETLYDLSGRKVTAPNKGLYINAKGQKVLR